MILAVDPKAQGLIFDFDGTLGDTLPNHYKSWLNVGWQFKFNFTEDFFYQVVGMSSENIVRKINQLQMLELDVDAVVKAKNESYLKLAVETRLIQPVFDIVKSFHNKLPMALGTSEYKDIALANVKATGLNQYFKIIVTADDVKSPKPEPEIFLKCATLMGVPPEYCQVFEDGFPGFTAAKRAGMILTDVRPYIQKNSSQSA